MDCVRDIVFCVRVCVGVRWCALVWWRWQVPHQAGWHLARPEDAEALDEAVLCVVRPHSQVLGNQG